MRILFLHDNFPAQFGSFGQFLWKNGWEVWFGTQRKDAKLDGFNVFVFEPHRTPTEKVHPYVGNFEKAVITGQGVARAGVELVKRGFKPDIIMAHSGWGPGLFVKDIWPEAKYVGYFEWFYKSDAPDIEFLLSEPPSIDAQARARARNAPMLVDLVSCDAALCPTEFQKSQFPARFDKLLTVMHDGIDTEYFSPRPGAKLKLADLDLSQTDEIITYVARGMEPYRGFPQFMKTLEILLKERPKAHAVIVGDDRVAYGKKLAEGDSYKKRALAEIKVDWDRVHFTGLLPRAQYRDVLLASSVHAYLTIPFVLSWSMMEAMSAGCAIVASNVEPVREIADAGDNPLRLVDMNDARAVADAIGRVLDDKRERERLGRAAREVILSRYAARDIFVRKLDWLNGVAGASRA